MISSFDVAPCKIPLWSYKPSSQALPGGAVGIMHVHEYNYGCSHHKIGYIAVAPETMSSLCLPTYQLEVINGYKWPTSHIQLGHIPFLFGLQTLKALSATTRNVFYMVPNDL